MAVDFRSKQAEFAGYIRDPANQPAPVDVDAERMQIYHELFFNNIDSFLSGNFPVIRQILNDEQWLRLARHFYANHSCRTPHFSEIAEEFLEYLQNHPAITDYPFLLELAHYEWVEMALSIAKVSAQPGDESFINQINQHPLALSPLAWSLAYAYPVQRISPDYLPTEPAEQPTYLIVYRDQAFDVHFMQSTALIYRLLQILEENPDSNATDCLQILAAEVPSLSTEVLFNEGIKILQDMAAKGIVIPGNC